MDDILILQIPFRKDEFLKANSFRLKLAQRPAWRQAIGFIITSSLFLVFTAYLYLTDQPNSVFLIVTIAFCIVTIIIVSGIVESKKKYLKRINELADKWEETKMGCTFKFDDTGIQYNDKEKSMDLKWNVFKYVLFNDNYIIFTISDSFDNAYFLSRRQIDEDTWTRIIKLASGKLQAKTIPAD